MARLSLKCELRTFGCLFKHFQGNAFKRSIIETERRYSSAISNYRIRNITEADIPKIADIRKTLKVHDCVSSLYSFHKLDPEAIIVAEDDQGNIIGTHSMLNFAKGLYVSGLTYVHPNYRKNNLALEMIRRETVRHRQENRLLVSVTFKEWARDIEKILGFKMEIGITSQRYISTANVDTSLLSDDLSGEVEIRPFEASLMEIVSDYDLKVANYERRRYLELSCNEPNSKTLIALKSGRCVGFGSIKLSCSGEKRVGPLYADDPKIAEALLKSLLEKFHEGKGVMMVVPGPNLKAEMLVNKLGTIPFSWGLYQIYEKGFPQSDVSKVYSMFDTTGTSI